MDWQKVCKQHGPLVWKVAYRLLGNSADASDCFQDCFLTAFELSGRQKIRNISALLTRIATQRAIDLMRRNQTRRRAVLRYPQENTIPSRSPEHLAQTAELAEQLRDALAGLPAEQAEAFCLKHLNDLSYRQIARQLNQDENYVGVLIHRARGKLQQTLNSIAMKDENEVAR